MAARNDITGDTIQSRENTQAFKDGWERIFGQKKEIAPDNGPDQRATEEKNENTFS